MKFNPFYQVTEKVMQENAGKTLAIRLEDGMILASCVSVEVLQHKMRTKFPDVAYARLTLPDKDL